MKIVLVASRKGGVGKSSISHALAYGATLSLPVDVPVLIGHCDMRNPIPLSGRGYTSADLRDPAVAAKAIERASDEGRKGLFILDVGANLEAHMKAFAKYSDLILIPVEDDYSSVEDAMESFKLMDQANKSFYVINRAPSKFASQYPSYKEEVIDVLGEERILYEFPHARAIRNFVRPDELDSATRSRIRPYASALYSKVEELIFN